MKREVKKPIGIVTKMKRKWKFFVIDFMQIAIKNYNFLEKITMEIFEILVYYIAVREE